MKARWQIRFVVYVQSKAVEGTWYVMPMFGSFVLLDRWRGGQVGKSAELLVQHQRQDISIMYCGEFISQR